MVKPPEISIKAVKDNSNKKIPLEILKFNCKPLFRYFGSKAMLILYVPLPSSVSA